MMVARFRDVHTYILQTFFHWMNLTVLNESD